MTTTVVAVGDAVLGQDSPQPVAAVGPDMQRLRRSFPPRPQVVTWPTTQLSTEAVLARLLSTPFTEDIADSRGDDRPGPRPGGPHHAGPRNPGRTLGTPRRGWITLSRVLTRSVVASSAHRSGPHRRRIECPSSKEVGRLGGGVTQSDAFVT